MWKRSGMRGGVVDGRDLRSLKRTRGGRERLLTVSAELFGSHGLAGTSLQMIADRLGVTKAAIYHHFRSREEIVDALMEPVLADAAAAAERIGALPVGARPAAAREFYADFVVAHRTVISMVFFDRAALKPADNTEVDRLVNLVAAVLADGDDDAALAAGEVLVYGIAALVTRRTELDDEALRRLVRDTLTNTQARSSI
jgi:AcrR family transcriptional regulator